MSLGDSASPQSEPDLFRQAFLDFLLNNKARSLALARETLAGEKLSSANAKLAARIGRLTDVQKEAIVQLLSETVDLNVVKLLSALEGDDPRRIGAQDYKFVLSIEPFGAAQSSDSSNPTKTHVIRGDNEFLLEEAYFRRDYDRGQDSPQSQ